MKKTSAVSVKFGIAMAILWFLVFLIIILMKEIYIGIIVGLSCGIFGTLILNFLENNKH